MHTEITDNKAARPAGWIFFDAECRFCAAHRRRWGAIFERRGFVWLPLQTPGAAERLGVTDSQLREEMWLLLADGRKFSGVNAWSVQMRHVWWMWPLGILLALPGCNAGARVLYRWIAKNRHCLAGTCAIHSHGKGPPSARGLVLLASLAVALAAVLWSWRGTSYALAGELMLESTVKIKQAMGSCPDAGLSTEGQGDPRGCSMPPHAVDRHRTLDCPPGRLRMTGDGMEA